MKPGRPTTYTRDYVLNAALKVAHARGYRGMTREEIAQVAGCSPAQVSHLLGTMVQLRRSILRHAIRMRDLKVIAQAIAAQDPHIAAADDNLKRRALESLL